MGKRGPQPENEPDLDTILPFALPSERENQKTITAISEYLRKFGSKESAFEANGRLLQTMSFIFEMYSDRYHPNQWILFYRAIESSRPIEYVKFRL